MNTGIGRNSATIGLFCNMKSTVRVNKDDIDGFIITYDFTSVVWRKPVAGMPVAYELSDARQIHSAILPSIVVEYQTHQKYNALKSMMRWGKSGNIGDKFLQRW